MKQYWVIFALLLLVSGCGMTGQLFSGSLFSRRAAAVETRKGNSREVTFLLAQHTKRCNARNFVNFIFISQLFFYKLQIYNEIPKLTSIHNLTMINNLINY